MDEAQALAGRVAVMVDGRIVAEGPPGALGAEAVAYRISFRVPTEWSTTVPTIEGLEVRGGEVVVRTDRPTEALHRLSGWAIDAGVELEGLSVGRPSLEDVYLALTSEPEAKRP
jgi:ABC-2 type transport system ATP-binding protein